MTDRDCIRSIIDALALGCGSLPWPEETLATCEALLREQVAQATAALTARVEWQAQAVGILKAMLDRSVSVSVDEFVSRVQAFLAKGEAT